MTHETDTEQRTAATSPGRPLRCLLFDLDGTLVNTGPLITESLRYTFQTVLGFAMSDAELTVAVGTPLLNQMQAFAAEHYEAVCVRREHGTAPTGVGASSPAVLAEQMLAVYTAYCAEVHDALIRPFDGIDAALATLRSAVPYLGVVTSKRHAAAQRDLAYFGLNRYFDVLVGADDIEHPKPSPEPVLRGLQLLNPALSVEECAYMGDSPYDIASGRDAGVFPVAVTYGLFDAAVLLAEKPALVLHRPSELSILEKYC